MQLQEQMRKPNKNYTEMTLVQCFFDTYSKADEIYESFAIVCCEKSRFAPSNIISGSNLPIQSMMLVYIISNGTFI